VNYDRLWAPWRLTYVTGDESSAKQPTPEPVTWADGADHSCFMCRAAATYDPPTAADRALLVVRRDANTLVVINRYPYNNGHLLVAPARHVGDLSELTTDEHLECMQALGRLTSAYRGCLNAEGFNIGLNLGRVAGAGLPGHLHWHLVPRWHGDNNFMPVLSGVRVIPQSLDELWCLLQDELASSNASQ
jgi:ATP adenylyltransferase